MTLADQVAEYERSGCHQRDGALGIQAMPEGYALMLDADEMYYFWLRSDGAVSAIHWNKWAVWRWAKAQRVIARDPASEALEKTMQKLAAKQASACTLIVGKL